MHINLHNFKKFLKFIYPFIVLFISLWANIRNCSQDRKMMQMDYSVKAMGYKPFLKVVGKPVVQSFEIFSDTNSLKMSIQHEKLTSTDSILDIPAFITVHFKLPITNNGNSLSKIIATCLADTLTGTDILRRWLFNGKLRKLHFDILPSEDYFTSKEVAVGETVNLQLKRTVGFISEGQFTLHFFILYENDIGNVYDTYYWARYQITPLVYKIESKSIGGKQYLIPVITDRKSLHDFLKFEEANTSWFLYPPDKAKILKNMFK